MSSNRNLGAVSHAELLTTLQSLCSELRCCECRLLVYLGEVDERALYLDAGYSSLFSFCCRTLRFSEGAAYRRIASARAARRWPMIYDLLESGQLNTTTVARLAPLLTAENQEVLLQSARGLAKTELDSLLAAWAPRADVKDLVRKLPHSARQDAKEAGFGFASFAEAASPPSPSPATAPSPLVAPPRPREAPPSTREILLPRSPGRVLMRFSAGDGFAAQVQRAQELLSHKYPLGQLEDVLGEALDALLEQRAPERRLARKLARRAATAARSHRTSNKGPTRSRRRTIPVAVKEAAWTAAQGQCSFVSPEGLRCSSRHCLQFDHVQPFALGGLSTVENIRILCGRHNRQAATKTFGARRR